MAKREIVWSLRAEAALGDHNPLSLRELLLGLTSNRDLLQQAYHSGIFCLSCFVKTTASVLSRLSLLFPPPERQEAWRTVKRVKGFLREREKRVLFLPRLLAFHSQSSFDSLARTQNIHVLALAIHIGLLRKQPAGTPRCNEFVGTPAGRYSASTISSPSSSEWGTATHFSTFL